MYVTENYMCFYSKFNDKTVFGKGTRLRLEYKKFSLLKKETGALMLPKSIKFGEIKEIDD
jgi:hypothetical protein